jgi:uncharacterized membrane protein YbhN (UPF0104 family)
MLFCVFSVTPSSWWTVVPQIRLLDTYARAFIEHTVWHINIEMFVICVKHDLFYQWKTRLEIKSYRNYSDFFCFYCLETCSCRNLFLLLLFYYDVLWALSHIVYTNRNPIYICTRASERRMAVVVCLSCG